MTDQQKNIPQQLTSLAILYGQLMEASGCDPLDAGEVDRFIDGCNITTKIKREIINLYEEE